MEKMKKCSLMAVAKKTVELVEEEIHPEKELGEYEIAGTTLYSLVSAGTEINGYYENVFDWPYPIGMGYSAVFRVEKTGAKVTEFQLGDLAFTSGLHSSWQEVSSKTAVKVPEGMAVQEALFARMAGISLATLGVTNVRPPETVMVIGLGCVGLLAAQYYARCGYHVIAVEPNAARREMAKELGVTETYASQKEASAYAKKVGLVLECSGVESTIVEAADMVRPCGEISVIGVPWKQYSDASAFQLLNKVFYNYVHIYSGWEWQIPTEPQEYHGNSGIANYRFAMECLAKGEAKVDGMYEIRSYREGQAIYDDIYHKKTKAISQIIRWEGCEEK